MKTLYRAFADNEPVNRSRFAGESWLLYRTPHVAHMMAAQAQFQYQPGYSVWEFEAQSDSDLWLVQARSPVPKRIETTTPTPWPECRLSFAVALLADVLSRCDEWKEEVWVSRCLDWCARHESGAQTDPAEEAKQIFGHSDLEGIVHRAIRARGLMPACVLTMLAAHYLQDQPNQSERSSYYSALEIINSSRPADLLGIDALAIKAYARRIDLCGCGYCRGGIRSPLHCRTWPAGTKGAR